MQWNKDTKAEGIHHCNKWNASETFLRLKEDDSRWKFRKHTPGGDYMGKYKEILSVSNKVNTYLTLRVRNVPPSCMDAGRSTLAECFFTSCGNTDSSAYPNQVFVESMQQLSAQHLACSKPTVFLYIVILYSVYVCVGGAGGRRGPGGSVWEWWEPF